MDCGVNCCKVVFGSELWRREWSLTNFGELTIRRKSNAAPLPAKACAEDVAEAIVFMLTRPRMSLSATS
jgi:hypothetical protein